MIQMFSQLLQLLVFLALGALVRKKGLIGADFAPGLSRIIVNLFLPCLLFLSFYNDLSPQTLVNERQALLWGVGSFAVTYPIYTLLAKRMAKDPYDVGLYQYTFLVPNNGFFGFALVEAVYGAQMLFHMVIFSLPHTIYCYTEAYRRLSGKKQSTLRALCNPTVFAMVLGAACGLLQIRLPAVLTGILASGKSCIGPLSMILTGMVIAGFRPAEILKDRRVYLMSAMRLLILPAATLTVMKLLQAPWEMIVVGVYFFCMPTGMNTVLFPTMVNRDCRLGAGMALISSVCLAATLPLMSAIFL